MKYLLIITLSLTFSTIYAQNIQFNLADQYLVQDGFENLLGSEYQVLSLESLDKEAPSLDMRSVPNYANWKTTDSIVIGVNLAANAFSTYGVFSDNYNDKQKHFFVGYVLGSVGTGLTQLILPRDMSKKKRKLISALVGFGLSAVVGTGKELRDIKYGTPEVADAIYTAAGGLSGSLTLSLTDIGKLFKKKEKRSNHSK